MISMISHRSAQHYLIVSAFVVMAVFGAITHEELYHQQQHKKKGIAKQFRSIYFLLLIFFGSYLFLELGSLIPLSFPIIILNICVHILMSNFVHIYFMHNHSFRLDDLYVRVSVCVCVCVFR